MKSYLLPGARLMIAVLFLAAGLPKIIAPQDFALALFRYHLLPDATINIAALLLPWLEILAALALLLPGWRKAGAACLAGLLGVATVAIAVSLARGLDIDCGCFTLRPGRSPISMWNIARNLMLVVLVLLAGWRQAGRVHPAGAPPSADEQQT